MRAKLKTILPLLLAIYITVDTILKANNIELCSSTGCELAGDLLKFDSLYLNYLGIFGALVLVVLSFVKSEVAAKLYTIAIASMVAFESFLIASQLNLNPELCKFCLGVYAFLLLILLNNNFRVFGYMIPIVASIFVAFSILAIPKNKTLVKANGLYLIASKTCPHCKKTKAFLDKNGIKYSVIKSQNTNAFYLAKSLNIHKIPIAIEKKDDSIKILVGDKKIIEYFSKTKKAEPKIEATQNNFQPKLNLGGDEGCSYSPIQEPSCESENGSTN